MNLGFLVCGFQLAFIASHLPAYLLDRGLRVDEGVAALAIIALANVAGTYAAGLLGARWSRKRLLVGVYLAQRGHGAVATGAAVQRQPVRLLGRDGPVVAGHAAAENGIVAQVFGVRYLGTLFGFVFLGHQLGGFLGVWMGAVVFEATRSYDTVWLMALLLGVIAVALHCPIDERPLVRPAVA